MATSFHLPYTPPFSFDKCLQGLYRSPDEILYQVSDARVFRALRLDHQLVPFMICEQDAGLKVETDISLSEAQQHELSAYVQNWFDLEKDLLPFYALLKQNPKLIHLPDQLAGLRIIGIPDLFEAICWSIIGQQINLTFAHKLKRRLVEIYGEQIDWRGHSLHLFPQPETLLELDEVYLHEKMQFSRSKLKYLKNVSEAFVSGELSREKLLQIHEFEDRQKLLTSIKGIGIWSANYALMKALNQPEAIPFGDTGLTQALFNLNIIEDRKDEAAIKSFFESMTGWEAYTVFYLWQSL